MPDIETKWIIITRRVRGNISIGPKGSAEGGFSGKMPESRIGMVKNALAKR